MAAVGRTLTVHLDLAVFQNWKSDLDWMAVQMRRPDLGKTVAQMQKFDREQNAVRKPWFDLGLQVGQTR